MQSAANVVIVLVAIIHAYFLVLEMVLWNTPRGRAIFGTSEGFAAEAAPLAANQGLYNGFLSGGLVWALIASGVPGFHFAVFFLVCAIVAGVYGGLTVNRRILLFQSAPAVVALALVLLAQ